MGHHVSCLCGFCKWWRQGCQFRLLFSWNSNGCPADLAANGDAAAAVAAIPAVVMVERAVTVSMDALTSNSRPSDLIRGATFASPASSVAKITNFSFEVLPAVNCCQRLRPPGTKLPTCDQSGLKCVEFIYLTSINQNWLFHFCKKTGLLIWWRLGYYQTLQHFWNLLKIWQLYKESTVVRVPDGLAPRSWLWSRVLCLSRVFRTVSECCGTFRNEETFPFETIYRLFRQFATRLG